MNKRTLFAALALSLIVIILGAVLLGSAPDYGQLYQEALKDASKEDPARIARNLSPLSDSNPRLIRDSAGRILLVTWTSWNGYDRMAGEEMNLSAEVWTSVGRELQEFCKALPRDGWTLRTEQKLGLPPDSNKTRFVEMFVDVRDVFRPCPDPETDDTQCGLSFPANVSEAYQTWFNDLQARSYGGKGYPWTRLGYTYDWGSADNGHVGLSEYVVKPGSTVSVAGVYQNDAYCGKAA